MSEKIACLVWTPFPIFYFLDESAPLQNNVLKFFL